MKKYDAIIAGSSCLEMLPAFKDNLLPADSSGLLNPGKWFEMDGMSFTLDDTVPVTGLTMKRFGMNVFLNGLIGEDFLGKMLCDWLDKFHLAQGLKSTHKAGTPFRIVLAPSTNGRINLESPGSNQVFDLDSIDYEMISQSRLFHFGTPSLLKQFYSDEGKKLCELFSNIQNLGVITSLDFSLPDSNPESGKVHWPEFLLKVLAFTDVFAPGLEELLKILDPDEYKKYALQGGDIVDKIPVAKIRELGRQVIALGVKILLIRAGDRGVCLMTGDVSSISSLKLSTKRWNYCEIWCDAYPAEPNLVRNSSGAKFTSVAAFLTAILKGDSPELAVKYAAIAGRNKLYTLNPNELDNWKEMTEEIKFTKNEIVYLNQVKHESLG